ncbi:unnamed protein product [Bursaphelenchus xylophilus]|uniref:(pine wood nematode) hypothetical protein n=1 Tax=Bursaphelenchus xylophilus TaxID=6326 RepID=A0A1I7RT79_BURXY|nr:unnamed protein product [Bursaphelenchus xylophilus]CAG9122552.1 unnamed protein product [Bursaphelenchus xylophilus]
MAVDNWHQWISVPLFNDFWIGMFAYSIIFMLFAYIITEIFSIDDHFKHERRLVMIVTMPGIDQREFGEEKTIFVTKFKEEETKAQTTQHRELLIPKPT